VQGQGRSLLGGHFHMAWRDLTGQAMDKNPCWLQTWYGMLKVKAMPGQCSQVQAHKMLHGALLLGHIRHGICHLLHSVIAP